MKTVENWREFHRIAQDRLKSRELMTTREIKQAKRLRRAKKQDNNSKSW